MRITAPLFLDLVLFNLDTGFMNPDRWKDPNKDVFVAQLRAITDEEMATQQPYVRAAVLERLWALYRACEPHIDGTAYPVDVRYLMLANSVLKQIADYGRIREWVSAPQDPGVGADERAQAIGRVDRGLRELEAKQP